MCPSVHRSVLLFADLPYRLPFVPCPGKGTCIVKPTKQTKKEKCPTNIEKVGLLSKKMRGGVTFRV